MKNLAVFVLAVAVLLVSRHSHAEKNFLCDPPQYHKNPIIDWSSCDDSNDWKNEINNLERLLGKRFALKFDHKSFDDHYKAEEKKPNGDAHSPVDFCVTNAIGLIDDSGRGGGLYTVLSTQGGPQAGVTHLKPLQKSHS
jgi:hypothetical protein